MVQLWIKPGARPRFAIDVQPTHSVADVKRAIHTAKGVPIAQQRLIFQGAVLRCGSQCDQMPSFIFFSGNELLTRLVGP